MSHKRTVNLLVLEKKELFKEAASFFLRAVKEALVKRGAFTVALSGGSTPRALYSLIADRYADQIDWKKVHIFFGDERCVPPDDPQSNFRMANETLLSKVGIPPENIHRMKGELEPGEAAAEYTEDLRKFVSSTGIPKIDLILLGMGEDGHTASLFPGSEAVNETFVPVVSQYVPRVNSHRLTLTPPVLLKADRVALLVTGEEKAHALKQVIEGDYQPDLLPAQILLTADGEVTWFVDPAAASLLSIL